MEEGPRFLTNDGLAALFVSLEACGYEVHGPQVRAGAIVVDQLHSIDELPLGWTDQQAPGSYRLERRNDNARFGYAVGPSSWKPLLHPPREQVWTIERSAEGELGIHMVEPTPTRRAFFGVRPCELAAILRQDTVLAEGPHPDPGFVANRANTFVVVANCGSPAQTCFCTSTDTGPMAERGFDIALTEIVDKRGTGYVAVAGTAAGQDVLATLDPVRAATDNEVEESHRITDSAADWITRRLDADTARDTLLNSLESPLWEEIADRCLTCANCTMVCPTCFCTDLVDTTNLRGDHTDRWREWDSCFSLAYSRLGPGPHRVTGAARYRQWLTHKLATWIDQFGESGCVGCGRCITWCPVGIDLTAELPRFKEGLRR